MNVGSSPRRTMVCVTAQRQCERLIRAGSRIACGGRLTVVHIAPMDSPLLYGEYGKDDAQPLEFLYRSAKSFSADMIVEHNDQPLEAIAALALKMDAECVVLGASVQGMANPFGLALMERLPRLYIHTEP